MPQPRSLHPWRFARLAWIATAAFATYHFYYIFSQTQRISAALFTYYDDYNISHLMQGSTTAYNGSSSQSRLPKRPWDYFEEVSLKPLIKDNTTVIIKDTPINWCVLDEKNTFAFFHIPHAAEGLLQCWSWFQTRNKGEKCGFYFRGGISLQGKSELMTNWKNTLVNSMGCIVNNTAPPAGDHQYYLIRRKETLWFWRKEDVVDLRKKFIDFGLVNESRPSDLMHIGFVDRKTNRRVLNIKNITNLAKSKYPEAVVTLVTMEDLPVAQQIAWWSQQNIVVAAHGASLTNVIFLRNNSAIVEIFPAHYCPKYYFGELCKITGVRNYNYESNCTTTPDHFRARGHLRALDLEPPVDEIMSLVGKAVTGLNFSQI